MLLTTELLFSQGRVFFNTRDLDVELNVYRVLNLTLYIIYFITPYELAY